MQEISPKKNSCMDNLNQKKNMQLEKSNTPPPPPPPPQNFCNGPGPRIQCSPIISSLQGTSGNVLGARDNKVGVKLYYLCSVKRNTVLSTVMVGQVKKNKQLFSTRRFFNEKYYKKLHKFHIRTIHLFYSVNYKTGFQTIQQSWAVTYSKTILISFTIM